jgi:hypothetical protein
MKTQKTKDMNVLKKYFEVHFAKEYHEYVSSSDDFRNTTEDKVMLGYLITFNHSI